ncbi:hypothetical protein SFRURICE_002673 [Spodoptera frugiperda]|nr:hypothetical protein SFRURICE_002673 [Spodoptera frugiperda]
MPHLTLRRLQQAPPSPESGTKRDYSTNAPTCETSQLFSSPSAICRNSKTICMSKKKTLSFSDSLSSNPSNVLPKQIADKGNTVPTNENKLALKVGLQ